VERGVGPAPLGWIGVTLREKVERRELKVKEPDRLETSVVEDMRMNAQRRYLASDTLSKTLGRLARRVLLIDGARGSVWALVAALACLACGVWFDLMLELPALLRVIVLVASVLLALLVLALGLQRALAAGQPARLAERLDLAVESGGQILSAFDMTIAAADRFETHSPELSAGLARMAVARGTQLVASVPPRRIAPVSAVGRSLTVCGGIMALGLAFGILLPRLSATEWRRFADPFGDHPPFSPITFEVEPGDTQVVYGSGFEVHATVAGAPVEGVELLLQAAEAQASAPAERKKTSDQEQSSAFNDEVIPMFQEQEQRWRASVANVTRPLRYFVRARNARSQRFKVDVVTVPRIEDTQYRVVPPAYIRQPAYEGPLPQGGLAGLPGTEVKITIRSNRPLAAGKVVYHIGQARQEAALTPVESAGDVRVAGTFSITASGRIEAHVIDLQGQDSTDKVTAPVTLLSDERPFVRLIEPRAVSYATPTAVIPVVISAEDDYGISRLQLFRSLNDSRALPFDVPIADPPARLAYQVVPLPLHDYQLEPGDEIKLFARVEDNDRSGSATQGKGAESSVALIRIISQQEFDRFRQSQDAMETMMAKYQQANRRLESLSEEIEKLQAELRELKPGEEPSAELREKLKELAEQMEKEVEALRRLAAEKQPLDIDQELTRELNELADQIAELQQKMQQLAEDDQAGRNEMQQRLEELAQALREKREHLDEEVLQPLEKLNAVLPLSRDEQKFVQIYLRQRELADRLASLKGHDQEDDPQLKARMRDLEDEQRKLRSDLESLLNEIEEHLAGLPEEEEFRELRESAQDFIEKLRESGAAEAMLEAENGLAEFSGTRGQAGAQEAADILEQFLSKAGPMGQQGGGQALRSFRPQLGDALGRSLQQMLGRGQGMSQGGGSGYSAARSTADNVGLYGSDQNSDSSQATGRGERQQRRRSGMGPRTAAERIGGAGDGPQEAPGKLRATGGGEAAIPLRYRRQTGRYFQRVADELGDVGK
jgi:hypothetical protein